MRLARSENPDTTFPLPFIALPFRRFLTFTACAILMITHFPCHTAVLTVTLFPLCSSSFFFCFLICLFCSSSFVFCFILLFLCLLIIPFFCLCLIWLGKQSQGSRNKMFFLRLKCIELFFFLRLKFIELFSK